MPTEHKKSKSKANVEIKVEAQDLHPLGHYIDDRVELIRQIFMSLKSKTIKSIATDFMQGKSLETIQEYCLDELLGISKKRLQSIINASKCPDNTDSSDSDVENIEEHISLEEISSDSADDALHTKKSKGKSKAADNKNGTAGAAGSGKKEISVLELLELQARARAIRSQLALEPVTKIELDSDNESDDSSSSKVNKHSAASATTSANNKDQTNNAKSAEKTVIQEANGMQIIKPAVPTVKPSVRLKRNFRQRQNDDYDPDDDDETKSVDNSCVVKEADKKSDDEKEEAIDATSDEKSKPDEMERSPSPDLIPIIQEPETYCISSDSDEPGSSSVPKYINYPTVVREKLPETEDELFLKKIKEGSGVDLRDLIKARRGEKQPEESVCDSCETTVDTATDAIQTTATETTNANGKSTEVNNEQQELDKDTEPEEGELTDGDDQDDEVDVNQVTILSSDDDDDNNDQSKKSESEAVREVEVNVAANTKVESSSESSSSEENDSDTDSSDAPIFKEADDDDDIIDLGKDEELDFEVEQSVKEKVKKLRKTKKKAKIVNASNETPPEDVPDETVDETKPDDNDEASQVIEIAEPVTDSPDVSKEDDPVASDPAESDTWQTRWLRGRNVTKVMATSRLANKVRTKIKQKKSKTEQESQNADSNDVPAATDDSVTPASTPVVEEGSVQHYEVLVAQETESKNE